MLLIIILPGYPVKKDDNYCPVIGYSESAIIAFRLRKFKLMLRATNSEFAENFKIRCNFLSFSFLAPTINLPTAHQSPRVLRRHEQAMGLGQSFFGAGDFAIFYRQGIFKRMDFGIKGGGVPSPGYGVFFDLKYAILEQPFLLSLDLGLSSSYFTDYFEPGNEEKAWAWHPVLLFGGKHIYGGPGWYDYRFREWKLPMNESQYTVFSRDSFPGLKLGIMGHSISKRWEVNLELNYYHSSSEYFPRGVTFGFGVRRIFRPHKPEN